VNNGCVKDNNENFIFNTKDLATTETTTMKETTCNDCGLDVNI
jgi:hypothetical protein